MHDPQLGNKSRLGIDMNVDKLFAMILNFWAGQVFYEPNTNFSSTVKSLLGKKKNNIVLFEN